MVLEEKYIEEIKLINDNGFFPIYITTMMCETTFGFKSQVNALNAYNELELKKNLIQGWWYGHSEFFEAIDWYQNLMKDEVVYFEIIYKGKCKTIELKELIKEYLI